MDQQQAQQFAMGFIGIGIVVALVFVALFVWLFWRIFTKAGLSGPLALLVIVPFGPIIVLCILAFSDWKVIPAPVATYYPPSYPPPPPPPPAFQTPPPPQV